MMPSCVCVCVCVVCVSRYQRKPHKPRRVEIQRVYILAGMTYPGAILGHACQKTIEPCWFCRTSLGKYWCCFRIFKWRFWQRFFIWCIIRFRACLFLSVSVLHVQSHRLQMAFCFGFLFSGMRQRRANWCVCTLYPAPCTWRGGGVQAIFVYIDMKSAKFCRPYRWLLEV